MELVIAASIEVACDMFERIGGCDALLMAGAVNREWRAFLDSPCADRVWEKLCRAHLAKGLDTGWDMLASLKARPVCMRMTWKQLYIQRARCLRPLAGPSLSREPRLTTTPLPSVTPAHRDLEARDFLVGCEVYLLCSRMRKLGDPTDDDAVLCVLRDVFVQQLPLLGLQQHGWSPPGVGMQKPRTQREISPEDQEYLSNKKGELLERHLLRKKELLAFAMPHLVELFGWAIMKRAEWAITHALRIATELLPPEPTVHASWGAWAASARIAELREAISLPFLTRLLAELKPGFLDGTRGRAFSTATCARRWGSNGYVCGCVACRQFRVRVLSKEPLLSQLAELADAQAGGVSQTMCRLVNASKAESAHEFVWDPEQDDGDEVERQKNQLPDGDQISVGLFLIRKHDGKRLELTASTFGDGRDASGTGKRSNLKGSRVPYCPEGQLSDIGLDDDDIDGQVPGWHIGSAPAAYDSYGAWDLVGPRPRFGEPVSAPVRFEAQMHFRDARLRPPRPTHHPVFGVEDEDLEDRWDAYHDHVPQPVLSSIEINLLEGNTIFDLNKCKQCYKWFSNEQAEEAAFDISGGTGQSVPGYCCPGFDSHSCHDDYDRPTAVEPRKARITDPSKLLKELHKECFEPRWV
jgi:hypothetical protein